MKEGPHKSSGHAAISIAIDTQKERKSDREEKWEVMGRAMLYSVTLQYVACHAVLYI